MFYRKIGISQEYQYSEILPNEELNSEEEKEKEEEEEKWEDEETEKEARQRIKERVEREFENLQFPPRRGARRGQEQKEDEEKKCTCSNSEQKEDLERVEFEKVDFSQIGAKLRALSLSMTHLPLKKEEKRGKEKKINKNVKT